MTLTMPVIEKDHISREENLKAIQDNNLSVGDIVRIIGTFKTTGPTNNIRWLSYWKDYINKTFQVTGIPSSSESSSVWLQSINDPQITVKYPPALLEKISILTSSELRRLDSVKDKTKFKPKDYVKVVCMADPNSSFNSPKLNILDTILQIKSIDSAGNVSLIDVNDLDKITKITKIGEFGFYELDFIYLSVFFEKIDTIKEPIKDQSIIKDIIITHGNKDKDGYASNIKILGKNNHNEWVSLEHDGSWKTSSAKTFNLPSEYKLLPKDYVDPIDLTLTNKIRVEIEDSVPYIKATCHAGTVYLCKYGWTTKKPKPLDLGNFRIIQVSEKQNFIINLLKYLFVGK